MEEAHLSLAPVYQLASGGKKSTDRMQLLGHRRTAQDPVPRRCRGPCEDEGVSKSFAVAEWVEMDVIEEWSRTAGVRYAGLCHCVQIASSIVTPTIGSSLETASRFTAANLNACRSPSRVLQRSRNRNARSCVSRNCTCWPVGDK